MTWYSEYAAKAHIFIFCIRMRLRANMDASLECVGDSATLPQRLQGAGPLMRLRWEDWLSRVLRERQRRHLMGMVFLRRALSWKLKPFEQTGTSPWETWAQFISPSPPPSLFPSFAKYLNCTRVSGQRVKSFIGLTLKWMRIFLSWLLW